MERTSIALETGKEYELWVSYRNVYGKIVINKGTRLIIEEIWEMSSKVLVEWNQTQLSTIMLEEYVNLREVTSQQISNIV